MAKTLRELFVDRTRQSDAFRKMLEGQTRRRIMVLTAGPGMGKSWMLQIFAQEAIDRGLPLVRIDFADGQAYDALMLVLRFRDAFGAQHFEGLMQAIGEATSARVTIAADGGRPQPVPTPVAESVTVDTGGGDFAAGDIDKRQGQVFIDGPVVQGNYFVFQTDNPLVRQVIEDRITAAFFDCLAKLTAQTRAVFLFDTYERNSLEADRWSPSAADRWIIGQLLARIRDGKLPNVVVVLAGRRAPEFGTEWNEVLGRISLEPLECADIKIYLRERRGLSAITDAEAERLCQAVAGSPQVLGLIGDNLEQANKPKPQDDEW
ncbi:MAG TPA: hypothetical protein VFO07_20520 [Roseiflexaceae bacterium]|nr:hypothetical protein [Roseiflexaceae bacterium]